MMLARIVDLYTDLLEQEPTQRRDAVSAHFECSGEAIDNKLVGARIDVMVVSVALSVRS